MTIGHLCNPLIHPGQNKDVQEIIKKFITKKKVEECLELVTVHNVAQEDHEDINEAENEWLIIIKLQVWISNAINIHLNLLGHRVKYYSQTF